MGDLDDRVWQLVHEQMPPCDGCGRRLQPGWGATPVAVCTPCSTVWALTIDQMAQLVANARAMAEQGSGTDG